MAASVRIEDEAFADERYEDLAHHAGLADADHARGKMARIWRQCTIEGTQVLSNQIPIRVLGLGAIDALVRARLAEVVDENHVRIRGTEGRIEWLQRVRDNGKFGKRGGRPKKRIDRSKTQEGLVNETLQGGSNITPPAPAPAPANRSEGGDSAPLRALKLKVDAAAGDVGKERNRKAATAHPDRARVIDAFHQRYKAANGSKPTWRDKEVGQVGQLLRKHTADVLIARINFMFDGRAKFPPPPYTLDAFVRHIDAWVDAAPRAIVADTPDEDPPLFMFKGSK